MESRTDLDRVNQINNSLIMLIEVSSLARHKNIQMKRTFSEEFFKGIGAIVSTKNKS
jgi:hypothetical protein